MRHTILSALLILASCTASGVGFGIAHADQTDPSLEALFTELRDGSVLDANDTTARIIEIWSVPANAVSAVLYERAEAALYAEDLELATTLAGHMTGISPSFAHGWVLKGAIDQASGRLEGALIAFEKALLLEPRHFVARVTLADILAASGKPRAAFETYQEALKWNPHLPRAREQAAKLRRQLGGQEI